MSDKVSLGRLSNALLGIDKLDNSEVAYLAEALQKIQLNGKFFLHYSIQIQLKRLSRLIETADKIEEKLYSDQSLAEMNTKDLVIVLTKVEDSMHRLYDLLEKVSYGNLGKLPENKFIFNLGQDSQERSVPKTGPTSLLSKSSREKVLATIRSVINQDTIINENIRKTSEDNSNESDAVAE